MNFIFKSQNKCQKQVAIYCSEYIPLFPYWLLYQWVISKETVQNNVFLSPDTDIHITKDPMLSWSSDFIIVKPDSDRLLY